MKNIVITCGGTGGHLTPGIALAQSLEVLGCPTWLFYQSETSGFTTGIKISGTHLCCDARSSFDQNWGLLKFFKGFILSFVRSRIFFRKIDADVLVGFGGFSTAGPALAARTIGIPFHVHEANRVIGKAVRFLASRVLDRVYLPRGVTLPSISAEKFPILGIH